MSAGFWVVPEEGEGRGSVLTTDELTSAPHPSCGYGLTTFDDINLVVYHPKRCAMNVPLVALNAMTAIWG